MPQGAVLAEGSLINNRYRVLGLIGGGAMARVYRVEHVELGTLHALKEHQVEADTGETRENIITVAMSEARLLSKLSHPGIPKVTDLFREGGKVYFVMDFVEGQNLKSIVDRNGGRPLELPRVLRWGIQVCDVLQYLHSRNPPIIFRDIKPANLILGTNDTITMVDFGIARRVRQGATSDTIIFGSAGYAPPEQYGQGQTSPRSDIYALGATLHHLLTGRDPSTAPFKWPPVRSLNPEVPQVLERLIMKCLELDPNRRPESVETIRTGLTNALRLVETGSLMPEGEGTRVGSGGFSLDQIQTAVVEYHQTAQENGSASTTAQPHPGFIPATATPGRPGSLGLNSAQASVTEPERPRSRLAHLSPFQQFLFTVLMGLIVPTLLFCVLFPFIRPQLAPPLPKAAPTPVQKDSDKTVYNRQLAEYNQAVAARTAYDNLAPMQFTLDILVALALFFGIVRPRRPTRTGMVMTMGGVLGLICLTGVLLLPAHVPLFIGFAALEGLFLIPAILLLATDTT